MSAALVVLHGHQLGASLTEIDFHCPPQSPIHKGLRNSMVPSRKHQVKVTCAGNGLY
jgi:hypothetical protein